MNRNQLLEQRNEQRSLRAMRNSVVVTTGPSAEHYRDVLPQHRKQFDKYFMDIWNLPLIHNERSSDAVQHFWKGCLTRSFLANKTNTYNKNVVKFGEHPRQKISVYTPKVKPKRPLKVVMYVHGGVFVNGSEEVFEYLGKIFVQNGYIFVAVGFRQLVKYTYYDSMYDVDLGFKKCVEIIPAYGGDTTEMVVLTWSGGSGTSLPILNQDRGFYDKHVKLVVASGNPFEHGGFPGKIVNGVWDHYYESHHSFMYNYLEQGPLTQRLEFLCGSESQEFPFIYQQHQIWIDRLKDIGYDTDLYVLENNDHYDAVLTAYVLIDRIRQFQVRKINPRNELSQLLCLTSHDNKEALYKSLSGDLWKPTFKAAPGIDKRVFEENITRINHATLKQNPLEHFQFYETAAALQPNGLSLLIAHNTACSAVLRFGGSTHLEVVKQSEQRKRPVGVCMQEFGSETSVGKIDTTAFFNPKAKQFTLDSIAPFSRKYWCDGFGDDTCVDYAIVFAKTVVDSKTQASEGANAFLVEVRDPTSGALAKNVKVEDLGEYRNSGLRKGSVYFDKVTLEKGSMLEGVAKINDQGKVESQLKPHSRITAYVDGMTYWHEALSSCAIGLLKASLFVGIKASRNRLTSGETHKVTDPLLYYQLHQQALIPLAARTLAYNFSRNLSSQQFVKSTVDPLSVVLSNLSKSRITDYAVEAISTVSSYTGVLGVSTFSRLPEYQQAARVLCSEAGDNKMLAIRVSRELVKLHQSGKYQLPQTKSTVVREVSQLGSIDVLLELVRLRQRLLFEKLVGKFALLRGQAKTPQDIYSRFLAVEQLAHANAYFDRISLEQTVLAASRIKHPEHSDMVLLFARLFAAEVIHNSLALFLTKGVIEARAAEGVAEWVDGLIKEGALKVDFLLVMWNTPKEHLHVPLTDRKYDKSLQQTIKGNAPISRL